MTKVYFSTSLFPAIGLRSVNQIFYALTVAQSISPKTGSSQTPGNQYQSTNCKVAKKSLSAGFNLLTIAQEIGDFIGMALCHHTVPGSHATAELYGLQRRFIPMQSHWYRDWTQFLLNRKLVKLSKKNTVPPRIMSPEACFKIAEINRSPDNDTNFPNGHDATSSFFCHATF